MFFNRMILDVYMAPLKYALGIGAVIVLAIVILIVVLTVRKIKDVIEDKRIAEQYKNKT